MCEILTGLIIVGEIVTASPFQGDYETQYLSLNQTLMECDRLIVTGKVQHYREQSWTYIDGSSVAISFTYKLK